MSSKRLSTEEPIYHPKKRALFEHKRQSELLKYETVKSDHVPGEGSCKNDFMALKMKLECSQSDIVCMRPRSDSLHSMHSLASDQSESVSSASRESSPNMDLFDSRTPERNPAASLNPGISKPLFPVCYESDFSLTENSENNPNLLNQNLKSEKANGNGSVTQFDVSDHALTDMQQTGASKRTYYRQESMHQPDYCVDNDRMHVNRPYLTREQSEIPIKANFSHLPFAGTGDHEGSRYVGPMVSLLSRFNREAVTEHVSSENSTHHVSADYVQGKKECKSDRKNLSMETARTGCDTKDNTWTSNMKIYKCRICNKDFNAQDELKSHMKEDHSGPQPYKCEHCPRAFSQYNNLQRHLRVHRANIYKCKLCDREFNEEFYLNMHMGTHTGKRVYSCGVCSASFTSNQDLKLHVKTHSPSQLHTCDICGKSFSKACVLRQHKKGHSGERPHKCDKCPKTFIHRHHLTMHMRSHSEEKQYSCDICNKEFYQSSHLYKHLKAHEEEGEVSKEVIDKMELKSETGMVSTGANKENTSRKRSNTQNKGRNPSKTFTNDDIGFNKTDIYKATQKLPSLSEAFVVNKQNHAIVSQHQSTLQGQLLKPSIPYSHPSMLTQSLYPNFSSSNNYQHWYPAYHSHLQAYYNNLYMMRHQPNTTVDGQGFYGHREFPVNSLFNTSDSTYISGTNTDKTLHRALPKKDPPGKDSIESSLQRIGEKGNTPQPTLTTNVDHLNERPRENKEIDQPDMEDTCQINFRNNEQKSLSFIKTVEDIVTKSNKNSTVISGEEKTSKVKLPTEIPQNYNGNSRIPMGSLESKLLAANSRSDPLFSLNNWVSMPKVSPAHRISNEEIFTNKPPLSLDCVSPYYMNRASYPVNQQYSMYPFMNSQQLVSTNSFLIKSPGNTDLDRAEPKPNMTQKLCNSPKKRHYSSQDIYIIKKPLRKDESQLTNRQRHLSECPQLNVATSGTSSVPTVQSQHEVSRTESCKLVHPDINQEVSQEVKMDPYLESIKTCNSVEEFSTLNQRSDTAENMKLLTMDKKDFGKENFNKTCGNGADSEDTDLTSVDVVEGRVVALNATIGTHIKHCSSEMCSGEIGGREKNFHNINTALNDSLEEKNLEIDFDLNEKIMNDEIEHDEMRQNENGRQSKIKKDEFESGDKHVDKIRNEGSNVYEYLKTRQVENVSNERDHNETGISETCYNTSPLDLSMREQESTVEDSRQSDIDKVRNSIGVSQRSIIRKSGATDFTVENPGLIENQGRVETEIKGKSSVIRQGMTSDLNNVCGLCWMKFDSKAEFENHQVEHAQKLDKSTCSKCQFCDKVFTRPFDLQCHLLKHREYDLDDKNLGQSVSLLSGAPVRATKTETQTDLQESSEGNKSQPALSSIQHEKTWCLSETGDNEIQAGIQVYKCDVCAREFSHKHNLNRHKMSHSQKCYECKTCKRTFKEKYYLQMHIKTHVEEKTRACEICGVNVPKSELWKHTNEHLSNIVKNPTYKQIGCRVNEILQGKNVECGLTTDSQTRQVLAERKENMMNSGKSFSPAAEKRKLLNAHFNDFENNPALAKKKDIVHEVWRVENYKSVRDVFKVKNGQWN